MKITLLSFFCLVSCLCCGQNQSNIWYFGLNAGLDFNSGSPLPLTNGQLNNVEGCAVIADSAGQLLFYTDGVKVWNRQHQVMPNGTGLMAHLSATQSSAIIPKPGSTSLYYIITLDGQAGFNGVRYSVVDMNLAGGMGDVTAEKNILIYRPSCEKLSVTKHANGVDYWIVTHGWDNNAYHANLLTSAGLNTTPVTSNVGVVVYEEFGTNNYGGYMKISPDGTKLAAAHTSAVGTLELCDFNNTTGVVSNPQSIFVVSGLTGASIYGVEFSPNSKVLYMAGHEIQSVFQFDLAAPDIAASKLTLHVGTVFPGALQLGPDGKIYLAVDLHSKLGLISSPDVVGAGCNFQLGAVDLGGKLSRLGLPSVLPLPHQPSAQLQVASACVGQAVSPQINTIASVTNAVWDFGDGTTITAAQPQHVYSAAGNYNITVTFSTAAGTSTLSQGVIVSPLPIANRPADLAICDDNSDDTEIFDLSLQTDSILGTQGSGFTVTYHSSLSDAEAGTGILQQSFSNTQNPQTVYASVTSASGCRAITSFDVVVREKPVIAMADEYAFCTGSSTPVAAPPGFDSYLWSTGETTQVINAAEGKYTLMVFKDYGDVICTATKDITVIKSVPAVVKDILVTDWTDNLNSINVVTEGGLNAEYSIDGVTYQQSPVFIGLVPGFYKVYVSDAAGCGDPQTREVALLNYPKFFTPNGDGHNETWRISFAQFEPDLQVTIFDRWGKVITGFAGNSPGWDGTFNGRTLPATDYWFVVKRDDGREYKGHFSMLR